MHALTYPKCEVTAGGRQHLDRRIDAVVVWRVQTVRHEASFSGGGILSTGIYTREVKRDIGDDDELT